MENLIFSLNATVPIFFTMILGFVFRKVGLMDEEFTNKANKFVFQAALPALLFSDLSQANFRDVWNGTFVAYCALTTMICIVISILISCLWKDKSIQGEFVQGAYRSSAAILGIAFIQNIYGTSGMAPLMIIASVPIYNVMAVAVLAFLKPERERLDGTLIKKTLKGIATNPIILGILAGVIWSGCKLPCPPILIKTVDNLGKLATPLGLMAMGAAFDAKKALRKDQTGGYCYGIETGGLVCGISAGCCDAWIPAEGTDRHSCDAWFCHNGKFLCHGKKYGT